MADKAAPAAQHAYRNPLVPVPFPPMELFERGTVIDLIAKQPKLTPKSASEKLFPKRLFYKRFYRRWFIKWDLIRGRTWTEDELDEANARGQFPYRPSDLFLRMYADVLTCLPRDPLAGNVSPALLGTSGTIPLSIVSTIPDIMNHYHDCIVLAEKEVFLVTNYWQPSDSVKCIARALRELNDAVAKRNGQKIVVKVMWDRGDIHQLWHNHVQVKPSTWIPLGLPDPKEVPNLSLEVINFHRPLLGTFHQKALVVDRKVALVNSNNIQDRPNIEMMIHLEGPVVDSVYDTLLLSWWESFSPVPPTISEPSHYRNTDKPPVYNFSDSNPYLANINVLKAAKVARLLLSRQNAKSAEVEEENHQQQREGAVPLWWRRPSQGEGGAASFLWRRGSSSAPHGEDGEAGALRPAGPGRFASLVTTLVEKAREEKAKLAGEHGHQHESAVADDDDEHESHELADIPESPRSPKSVGSPTIVEPPAEQTRVGTEHKQPPPLAAKLQAAAAKAATAAKEAEIAEAPQPESSTSSDTLAPPAPHFANGSAIEPTASKNSVRLKALSKALNAGALAQIEAAIDDETLIDDYKPHFIHRAHKPVPMAMVNRKPHGAPGHADIRVPQDAAWLAGLRHAQKNAFIQTPTLNAKPVVRAIVEACSKGGPTGEGIIVTLILGLGFNDKGESVPFQGGTNEEVVVRLFNKLRRVNKQDNLHVYWYTGKDQIRPLNAVHKTRNCHVKYASFDDQVAVIGNGNQDTQSWTHSQEMNVMIDDKKLVADWMDQLRTNQSSYQYGRVDTDGIWRDQKTGEELDKPIPVSCITAIRAMI